MTRVYAVTVHYVATDDEDAEAKSWVLLEALCQGEGPAHDCPLMGGMGPLLVDEYDEG